MILVSLERIVLKSLKSCVIDENVKLIHLFMTTWLDSVNEHKNTVNAINN